MGRRELSRRALALVFAQVLVQQADDRCAFESNLRSLRIRQKAADCVRRSVWCVVRHKVARAAELDHLRARQQSTESLELASECWIGLSPDD